MRKYNRKFAQRMPRQSGVRTNDPQRVAHELSNSKPFQMAMNRNLQALLSTVGV